MSAGGGARDEHRQRERGHPGGGDQHGRANVLPVGGRDVQQPDRWAVAGDESRVDHKQQHHAADIACGPTESGYPTGRLRRRQLSQHRVVRDAGQVAARRGEPEQQQAGQQVAGVVADQAHRRCQQHRHRGQHGQRASASVRRVNPDPGDRRQHCDRHAGEEQRPAEPARRAWCRRAGPSPTVLVR